VLAPFAQGGRVPGRCGSYFEASPKPSERSQTAGHQPSNPVFWISCHPGNRSQAHLYCLASRSSHPSTLYTAWSCDHGGTRNISTSCSVHTWWPYRTV